MRDEIEVSEIKERQRKLDAAQANLISVIDALPELLEPITSEDGVDTDNLRETLTLVRDFISNDVVQRTYTHAPTSLRGRQPVNESFMANLAIRPQKIRDTLISQEKFGVVGYDVDVLKGELKEALERSMRKEHSFLTAPQQAELEHIAGLLADRLRNLDVNYALKLASKRANEAASKAEASAVKASSAAGVTADTTMSTFYEALGTAELNTANQFRGWAITLGVVAGGIACLFLFGTGSGIGWLEIEAGEYVRLIQRGLVLAAFLALATFLAKQSHQHRTMSNWARSLAVQLKTFDAFVDAVDDEKIRDELRKNFAVRVFGDHPAVKGEPAFSASSQSVAALTETVARILPAAR